MTPNLGKEFDPSQTASVPISTGVSPKGVHTVNRFLDPRPMYTLSTWAPVNCLRLIPLERYKKNISERERKEREIIGCFCWGGGYFLSFNIDATARVF